jgi:predicted amidohydrolase YtcJ
LVNGRFVDGGGHVGHSMTVRDGKIAAINRLDSLGANAKIINLGGRTVIPGLINMHVHHSRTGLNPGYEARDIETAFSIRQLQTVIWRRTKTTPAGKFICCHLGWHYVQLAENRPPTKAELDAAAPNHPVYVGGRAGDSLANGTFAVANTAGLALLATQGVNGDSTTGLLNATPEQAFGAVRVLQQTPEDQLRGTFDNNAWSLSLGTTNVLDPAGSPTTAQTYPALELWRQGLLHVRHRLNYTANNTTTVQTRANNIFRLMGDDLLRAGGFGETIGVRNDPQTTFEPVARAIAEAGWKLQNHTDFTTDAEIMITAFENIAQDIPLDDLRWQLIHAFQLTPNQLNRLKALSVGLDHESERYLDRLQRGGGPQYRQNVDSGIKIGLGTDGSNFCPNNPWLQIYYATTGINVRGVPENAAQKITRMEALKLFTEGGAYQNFDDEIVGSFDVGKQADVCVLNQDFLHVSDAQLRKTRSVLTLVQGRVVHQGDEPQYTPIGTEYEYTGT